MNMNDRKNRGRSIRKWIALGLVGLLTWQATTPLAISIAEAIAQEGGNLKRIYGILESSVGEPVTVEDYYELANIAIGEGDYEKALDHLEHARMLLAQEMTSGEQATPSDSAVPTEVGEKKTLMAELFLKTASVYIVMGDFTSAKAALDESLMLAPNSLQARLLRAQLAIETGDYLPAIDDLLDYLAASPDDVSTRLTLAQLYEAVSDYPSAIAQYETLAQQQPEDETHILNALRCCFLAGRYKDAIKGFDAYKERHAQDEKDPYNGVADFLRAACLMQLADYPAAVEGFEMAITAGYDEATCLEQIVLCQFEHGDYEQTVLSGERLLALPGAKATSPEMVFQRMGVACMRLERNEEAIGYLDKAGELKPGLEGNEYYRGVSLLTLGRYEEAVEAFTASIEQGYLVQFCYYNRGVCYVELMDYDKVIDDMAMTIESGDDPGLIEAAKDILWQLASYYENMEAQTQSPTDLDLEAEVQTATDLELDAGVQTMTDLIGPDPEGSPQPAAVPAEGGDDKQ